MPATASQIEAILRRHLGDRDRPWAFMSEVLLKEVDEANFVLFDGPKDLEALNQISRGLANVDQRVVASLSDSARQLLSDHLQSGFLSEPSDGASARSERSDFQSAFFKFAETASEIRDHVEMVRCVIELSKRTKRSVGQIKSDRLHVVDVAVRFWELYAEKPLPEAEIKEGQPFSRFLVDLFEVFEIDSGPVRAHRAWLAQAGRSPPLSEK